MPFEPQVTGKTDGLAQEVIDKLMQVSKNTKKPVEIISGAGKGSRTGTTAHQTGLAADVYIPGLDSEQIADELAKAGFAGIGVYYNNDGTPTNTAHGDIRGSEAARGTVYYDQVSIPATWNGRDVSKKRGVRVWEGTKDLQPWRWGPVAKPSSATSGPAATSFKKPNAPRAGKSMGKRLAPIFAAFLIFLIILFIVGDYLGPDGGGGGGGNWQIYTDTGQQYATLYVNSDGTFTGEGWTGYAPGIGTYDIYITNGIMSGTTMSFDTYATYGSGTITGHYYGDLDASFPAATSATWYGGGTISDPLGDRSFTDTGTATRS